LRWAADSRDPATVLEFLIMTSFYDIKAKKLNGEVVSMADYKGKVVLVENTATL